MSGIKKHIGVIKSTGQRCVVVFMQLPDDKTKSLIINTESLPPRYEQILMEVVNSPEGQQERDVANTLGRRLVPESGKTVLEEFHNRGFMRAESIDNVIMMPRPNTPFPLRDILESMGELTPRIEAVDDAPLNRIQENQKIQAHDSNMQMANNMLLEAEMLDEEASRKREAAYKYAPSLRPKVQKTVKAEEVEEKVKKVRKPKANLLNS